VKNVLPTGEKSTEFQAIENSRDPTFQQNQKSAEKDDNHKQNSDPYVKTDDAKVKRHIIAITIAVFVSAFCLMFPGSKNWADDKWARARQYSIEFPKLAMQLPSGLKRQGTSATRTWSFPFIWIWRFFTCLGKCTGISLPAWSTNWLNCIFECYNGKYNEKSDPNFVTSDTRYFRQDEFSNGFSKQTPSKDSLKRLHKSAKGSSKERILREESENTESKKGTKNDSSPIPTLDVKNTLVNKNNSTKSRQTNMHIVHSKSHSTNRIDE